MVEQPAQPSLTIIAPTRNEAANVDEFVKRAVHAMQDRLIDWNILFADDSDDDTPGVIEGLADDGHPVRCMHRPPGERHESIGGAVKDAMTLVTADFVVVIDADLQHPPEILPALVGPLWADTADFVVGTRYASGGSAEGLGSGWRRLASRCTALLTKLVLPQYWHCSDLASGLFAFRTADLDLTTRRPTGFKLLAESMVRCGPRRIAEVPYVFEVRVGGLSKARIVDGLRYARALLGVRTMTSQLRPIELVPAAGLVEVATVAP